MDAKRHKRIVCAMSGGVDSTVAALLLKEAGHDVIGISMQVWDYRNNGGSCSRKTCCAPDDFTDARKASASIGVPYYVFDFEKTFREEVIDSFIRSYAVGETPNPCVDCNTKVKFGSLRERARAFEADAIATGHYARIEFRDGVPCLLRGADRVKDQSYYLYGLTPEELSRTEFPVGHLTKPEVREIAKKAGLGVWGKSESQDICFVSGKASEFVEKIGGLRGGDGYIVRSSGEVVGRHEGVHRFTVGQRRGISIGGEDAPLYVLEIRPEEKLVVVGEKRELEKERCEAGNLTWAFEPASEKNSFECIAQVRSRHIGTRAFVEKVTSDRARITFLDAPPVASPGQAIVFYDLQNEHLLGGGRIIRENRASFREAFSTVEASV